MNKETRHRREAVPTKGTEITVELADGTGIYGVLQEQFKLSQTVRPEFGIVHDATTSIYSSGLHTVRTTSSSCRVCRK